MARKIRFMVGEGGEYILFADDDRIGFVRSIGPGAWAATDTYLVGLRGTFKTRKRAVAALVRRADKSKED